MRLTMEPVAWEQDSFPFIPRTVERTGKGMNQREQQISRVPWKVGFAATKRELTFSTVKDSNNKTRKRKKSGSSEKKEEESVFFLLLLCTFTNTRRLVHVRSSSAEASGEISGSLTLVDLHGLGKADVTFAARLLRLDAKGSCGFAGESEFLRHTTSRPQRALEPVRGVSRRTALPEKLLRDPFPDEAAPIRELLD
ncbi:hypothetical protein NL676_024353 [Syzygium grande]|nr:hypothetical protein NL676_024353 [Syzygium grande]